MTDADIDGYAHALLEEVRSRAETDGCDLREAFTGHALEVLCADGHAEDAVPVHFKDHGVEVSGYGVSSDGRCLDLFLTIYSPRADEDHKLDRATAEAAFKRLENFLIRCISGTVGRRERWSEIAGMAALAQEKFAEVQRVRLVVVTNARSVIRDKIAPTTVGGREVARDLWDLRRLANWATSGSKAEPIVAEFRHGLPCLVAPSTNDEHAVLLAIVPGRELAELYATHGARLLELNVRSFLQVRGTVNKGILKTLNQTPDRFLAYNNGIAATASSVDIEDGPDGQQRICRIHNLQIVNGGQTTATIHHAYRARSSPDDLGDVFVQMKLTVVAPELLDRIVPQISEYSNTQNKVTASDLKANSAFHVDLERIMRMLWAPAGGAFPHDTRWFYERARGQYANAVAREGTPARQKLFKTTNPPTQKFTKSDVAKFEHSWAMLPHLVSLGAEKNFTRFTERLDVDPITVDKDYCRQLVAKAILFRKTDKLVAAQNFGGYKANIVTYTIAKLVHAARGRIDLDRIWRDQDLTPALRDALVELAPLVQKTITSPPGNRTHVGEWAKREDCWEAVRDLDWSVPPALEAELAVIDTYPADLQAIRGTRANDWSDLVTWGTAAGLLTDDQLRIATEIAAALEQGWDPAGKHVTAGLAMMRRARDHGFRPVAGF